MKKRSLPFGLLTLALISLGAPSASAQEPPEFVAYTVQKGDTCTSIAKKFYGDVHAYDHIHAHNDLSADDWACLPGRELKLPKIPPPPEASLTAAAGNVNAKAPSSDWKSANVGESLFTSWKVNTLERSRAELEFRDESNLRMTENTLVIIYGPSSDNAVETPMRRATVERGRLKMALAELSGQPLEVETPTSVANFSGGAGQITVDGEETRVANHAGKSAEVRGKTGSKKKVTVAAGNGTRVQKGQTPEPPRPLPPTPTWTTKQTTALALGGTKTTVKAAWVPVKEAKRYYVELARDRRGIDVFFSGFVPEKVTNVEIRDVPPGEYFAMVASVDADKFESIPSTLHRVLVESVDAPPESVLESEGSRTRLLLGTAVRLPRAACTLDSEEVSGSTRLNAVGESVLNCENGTMTLEVVPPTITAPPNVRIAPGSSRTVEMTFAPRILDGVRFDSPEGIDVSASPVADDRLSLNIRASSNAKPGPVITRFGELELTRIDVDLDESEAISSAGVNTRRRIWISAMLGSNMPSADDFLGPDFPAFGIAPYGVISFVPNGYFGIEAGFGSGAYSGDEPELMGDFRASALVGLMDTTWRPYAGIGFGSITWVDHATYAVVRPSLGMMPKLDDHFGLRLDLSVAIAPDEEEDARVMPGVLFGAYWELW